MKHDLFSKVFMALTFFLCFGSGVKAANVTVTYKGETTTYDDLYDAFHYVNNGGKKICDIILNADITETTSGHSIMWGSNVTLDLNGHSLRAETTNPHLFNLGKGYNGTLTIKDSSEGKTGRIICSNSKSKPSSLVQIRQGEFNLESGTLSMEAKNSSTQASVVSLPDGSTGVVNISGGTMVATASNGKAKVATVNVESDNAKTNITGGKFSPAVSEDYLPSGYSIDNDGNVVQPAISVIWKGKTTTYNNLKDAFHYVNNGGQKTCEIIMNADLTETTTGHTIMWGSNFTLDLNGHTLTSSLAYNYLFNLYDAATHKVGTLTIKDSSEGQTGRIICSQNGNRPTALVQNRDGVLNIEGGTLSIEAKGSCQQASVVSLPDGSTGVVNITGGSLTATASNGKAKVTTVNVESDDAKTNITGGKFTPAISEDLIAKGYQLDENGNIVMKPSHIYYQATEGAEWTRLRANADNEMNINGEDWYAFKVEDDVAGFTVNFTRNFKTAGKYQAWIAPFDLPVTDELLQDYEFSYLDGIVGERSADGKLEGVAIGLEKLKAGQTVKANLPYIVLPKVAGEKTFTVENTTIYSTVDAAKTNALTTNAYVYKLTGVYEHFANTADAWYALANGVFSPAGASAYLKPFRFYLQILDNKDNPYGAKVAITLGAGETTGISRVDADEQTEKVVYDLQGRRVQHPTQKGIYIVNGRKVVLGK